MSRISFDTFHFEQKYIYTLFGNIVFSSRGISVVSKNRLTKAPFVCEFTNLNVCIKPKNCSFLKQLSRFFRAFRNAKYITLLDIFLFNVSRSFSNIEYFSVLTTHTVPVLRKKVGQIKSRRTVYLSWKPSCDVIS